MVTGKNDANDKSEINEASKEVNDEVSAAIAELEAAQARLDEAKANAEAIGVSEHASETVVVTEVVESVEEPMSGGVAPEQSAEPVVNEGDAPSATQASQTPNWAPYTPSAEPVSNPVPNNNPAGNAMPYGGAASMPSGVAQEPPVPPVSDPYAQAQYYAPQQNGGYQYHAQTPPQQQYYYQQPYQQTISTKDHVAAGLLGIFLGLLGIHKFYLGYNTSGFIMLAVTILGSVFTFGIAGAVIWLIGIIEGIVYLTKSQSEFEQIYVFNKREWF